MERTLGLIQVFEHKSGQTKTAVSICQAAQTSKRHLKNGAALVWSNGLWWHPSKTKPPSLQGKAGPQQSVFCLQSCNKNIMRTHGTYLKQISAEASGIVQLWVSYFRSKTSSDEYGLQRSRAKLPRNTHAMGISVLWSCGQSDWGWDDRLPCGRKHIRNLYSLGNGR